MYKKIIIIVLLCFGVAGTVGAYLYFKPARSYRNSKPELTVAAREIIHDYATGEMTANQKYLNKVVEVHGIVNDISEDDLGVANINLSFDNEMAMVSCSMDTTVKADFSEIKKGDFVRIKGLCTGMLMDVVLVKAVMVKE